MYVIFFLGYEKRISWVNVILYPDESIHTSEIEDTLFDISAKRDN